MSRWRTPDSLPRPLALGAVKESIGEDGPKTVDPITDLFPLRGAIVGANRVAELTENDRALGRSLARGGRWTS